MRPFNRKLAGRIAKAKGQTFENFLILQAKKTFWSCIQIPDGCKAISKDKMFRIKSPFDFVFANRINLSWLVFCDAKSTDLKTFPASKIKPEQVEELSKFAGMGTVRAGYIVQFAKLDAIVFFSVEDLEKSFKSRIGLKPSDGTWLGSKELISFNNVFE